MIAAALGRRRDESLDDLADMRYGVRADQRGSIMTDFHTVHHPTKDKLSYITRRQYLCDSCFLIGLESDMEKLREIEYALQHPYFALFLGRRSCPPSGKMVLGIKDSGLEEALTSEGWLASEWYAVKAPSTIGLDLFIEPVSGGEAISKDQPVSFSVSRRTHTFRQVKYIRCSVSNPFVKESAQSNLDMFEEVRKEAM
jgi:CRISPR system Cascade subunit CasD